MSNPSTFPLPQIFWPFDAEHRQTGGGSRGSSLGPPRKGRLKDVRRGIALIERGEEEDTVLEGSIMPEKDGDRWETSTPLWKFEEGE